MGGGGLHRYKQSLIFCGYKPQLWIKNQYNNNHLLIFSLSLHLSNKLGYGLFPPEIRTILSVSNSKRFFTKTKSKVFPLDILKTKFYSNGNKNSSDIKLPTLIKNAKREDTRYVRYGLGDKFKCGLDIRADINLKVTIINIRKLSKIEFVHFKLELY